LPPPPARLLDLGCGTGWTSCLFAKMGYDVVGQDIAPDMIYCANVNKQRYQTANVRFIVCDFEAMPFADEFDGAVFFDCLHHAEDERLALERVFRALRSGGVCVAHEPGEGHAESELSRHVMQQFNVTEKDMPPCHIMALAREIGYRNQVCFPFPEDVIERTTACMTDTATRAQQPLHKRLFRHLRDLRRVRARSGRLFHRAPRNGGLTVLTK
jgi:ubiquinone/menaquinone biosynthesis C-methylase UbiE